MDVQAILECVIGLVGWVGRNAEAIIAGCALFFTSYQTYALRKHNKLSVRPRLVVATETVQVATQLPALMERFRVTLTNAGLGPAIIKDYQVLIGDQLMQIMGFSDLDTRLRGQFGPMYGGGSLFVPRPGFVMKAGEDRELADLKFVQGLDEPSSCIDEAVSQLHLLVTYECIYGDTYKYDTRDHFKGNS